MNKSLVLIFLSLRTLVSTSQFDQNDVRSIAVVFRHGDRYPCQAYPNDPYENVFTQKDYGSLTSAGRVHMYSLGRNLRVKFPSLAKRKVTRLRSSIVPRCIESLQILMSGLNGPSESVTGPPDIFTLPKVDDALLNHGSVRCPKRKESISRDKHFQNLSVEYADLWSNVSQVTQIDGLDVGSFIDKRIEPIMSEFLMKIPMPKWATREIAFRAKQIIDHSIWLTGRLDIEGKLSGLFYQEVISRLRSCQNSSDISLFAYSTHDTTLGPILLNLGLWPGHRPFYGEGLVFLLTQNGSLRVYFYDEGHHLHHTLLPGCSAERCTLEMFEESVQHLIPRNWRAECGRKDSSIEA